MAIQPPITPAALPSQRTRWAWLIGPFFGVGYLRPGPGTYGSIAAVLLWLAAAHALQPSTAHLALGTASAALIVSLAGVRASTLVARESGREDPGFVVVDEVAGQLIALIALPATLGYAALGLFLFRVFDISKPWPIRRLEALPEGTGIMLDDLAAGALALLVAHLLAPLVTHFVPHFGALGR